MPRIKRNREKRERELEQRIWDHLFAHACVDCGEADLPVLHFDHLRDKVDDISTMFRRQQSWSAVLAEIAKCEVRCANCHARKTAREQGNYKTKVV
jgi:5-methylcytosine-specific restriction endonuclease McrA